MLCTGSKYTIYTRSISGSDERMSRRIWLCCIGTITPMRTNRWIGKVEQIRAAGADLTRGDFSTDRMTASGR
jgi:hypothetical protein